MPKNKFSAGIILLLAGIIIVLGKWGVFGFLGSIFWPLLVLIPGILIHVLYFGRIMPAVSLIPGGILVVYSLLFILCNIFGWDSLKYLWPMFILGIAVGLYEYYLFGSGVPKVVWTSAIILAATAVLFFVFALMWSWGIYLVAALLIGAGAWLTLSNRKRF